MGKFAPDPNARWRRLIPRLLDLDDDGVITYEELAEIVESPGAVRSAVARATRELEENHQRTTVNVRGVGYRLAKPDEHRDLAVGHLERSRSQVVRAKGRVVSADRKALESDDARYHDAMAIALGRMAQGLDVLAQRSAQHDELLDDHDERIAKLEEKVQAA